MNKLIGHFGDKFSIYLLVFIIGSLTLYYVFAYIPQNQQRLDNYGVRILENKALAVSDKYKGYDNAVSSAPISYFCRWFFHLYPTQKCLFLKEDSLGTHYSGQQLPQYNVCITRTDFTAKARVDPNLIPVKRDAESRTEIKRVWRDDRGASYFIYTPSVSFYDGLASTIKEKERRYPLLRTKISDFTANLKENDFFEDIFLVRAHRCQDCQGNAFQEEISGYGNFILDESKLGLVQFNLNDSAKDASSGIYQATVLGKQYKIYYKMIKLRRGLDVYAVGLIPLDVFKAEAKRVSVWFLVFCSLGALLLIFLFPVLKLFLLSQGERLFTRDISLGVFSVMLCTCLGVILSIGFYFFWGLEMQRSDEDIRSLANSIKNKANQELNVFGGVLTNRKFCSDDQKINTDEFKSSIGDYSFNEVFVLDSSGLMRSLYTEARNLPDVTLFPVSVAERNYFKAVRGNAQLDYFLQLINSFSTGRSEVAISMPLRKGQNGYADVIGVVTTPFRSVLESGIPSPYKFLLLDDAGDVKFHSGWNQIKSENFLSELENYKPVGTFLKNAITDYVDFTYLRRECRGYVTPVVKNWSVIVYYEQAEIYNLSARIFVMCLISLFIVVLFCAILHLFLRTDKYKPVLLRAVPFMYAWLNPNNFEAKSWWYLFRVNLWILATEVVGLYVLDSFVSTLLFSLLTITSAYVINYFVLGPKPFSPGLIYLILLKFVLMVSFLIVAPSLAWLLCLPILGWTTIVMRRRGKTKATIQYIPTINDRQKSFLAYRFFMICWLMIVIVGPAVGFLVRHYEHEKLMTTYAYLIDDVQRLREKANNIDSDIKDLPYYTIQANDVQEILEKRTMRCDMFDSLYYNQLPQFTFLNGDDRPLQFNYVPYMRDLTIAKFGDIVKVSSNTNALGITVPEIKKYASLKGVGTKINQSAGISLMLVLVLGILLWWALSKLSRKVFYLPLHAAWTVLPPPDYSWGNIKFEFSNVEKDLHLLNGVASKIKEKADSLNDNRLERWQHEKLILELQEEQNNFYKSHWTKCSDEEKFFLYDLSEDGIVNHPNDELLKSLSKKKLLRLYPRLEIVNASFADFIRRTIQKEEVQKMERQESKDGRWKHIRILLIIIILAAFAFLSIAEENFFGRATALIGSITLLLPNLMTLFGSISKLFAKTTVPITGG